MVGVPDDKWGERPVAFVVLQGAARRRNPTRTPSAITCRTFAERGAISKYAVPDRVHFVDTIPKTSVGKLDKKVIRARLADAVPAAHDAHARSRR